MRQLVALAMMMALCAGVTIQRMEDRDDDGEGMDVFRDDTASLKKAHEAHQRGEHEAATNALPNSAEEAVALVQYDSDSAMITTINGLVDNIIASLTSQYATDVATAQTEVVDACNLCVTAANTAGSTTCSGYKSTLCTATTGELAVFQAARSAWQGTTTGTCSQFTQQCYSYQNGMAGITAATTEDSTRWPAGNSYTTRGFDETGFDGQTTTIKSTVRAAADSCTSPTNGGFPAFLAAYNAVSSTCNLLKGCRTGRCTNYDTCWDTAVGSGYTTINDRQTNTCTNMQNMERMLLYTKCMVTAAAGNATVAAVETACGTDSSGYTPTITCATVQNCGDKVPCTATDDVVCDSDPNTTPTIDGPNTHTWQTAAANDNDVVAECATSVTAQQINAVPAGGQPAGTNAGGTGGAGAAAGGQSSLANLVGLWDANFAVTNDAGSSATDGEAVLSWGDSSTKGYTLATRAADRPAYQPSFLATGINGHPAIQFDDSGASGGKYLVSVGEDGTDTPMHHVETPCNQDVSWTWVAVVQWDSTGGWTNLFTTMDACSTNPGGYSWLPASMSNDGMHGWSSMPEIRPVHPANTCGTSAPCVIGHVYDGSTNQYTISVLKDGSDDTFTEGTQTLNPHCGSESAGCVVVGRGMQNNNHRLPAKVGEILAFDNAMSVGDLHDLMSELKMKWAAGASSPSAPTGR